ncbi:hypothetical protein BC833DRAFT_587054 [Globomyces pollinis-pini]|nr:hypothetical protein BC833DRAFT_587054 [Globomyces pollinis-pini]
MKEQESSIGKKHSTTVSKKSKQPIENTKVTRSKESKQHTTKFIESLLVDKSTISKMEKPKIERVMPSSVLDRLKNFLPELKSSNEKLLNAINKSDYDIEKIDNSDDEHIEMNLDLGVFDVEYKEKEIEEHDIKITNLNTISKTLKGKQPLIQDVSDVDDVDDK